MSMESLSIIDQISREKGIDKDILIDALKSAVEVAARKRLPHIQEIHTEFNEETGEVGILAEKTVVKKVENPDNEISLKEATKTSPDIVLGEKVLVPQALENYGRIAAQLAKQVILQKVREAEVDLIYQEYTDKKGCLVNGMASRFEHGDIIVDLGKTEGVLPRREQVFRETFNRGERIRAYVLDVRKTSRNATVILSRTHVGLIKNLFELEVPEINEGMVEIMGIVREPNGRTKIAVQTNDRDIDAVGACVGMRGMRVQSIVQELRGEKIDIVQFSEDPEVFIRNALSPAKISRIIMNEEERHMTIIVADDQMSLAIGKKGQNVRLAAKLVKWKIDIQGESQTRELMVPALLGGPAAPPGVDFLEAVKDAKGLGKKITAILFENNVVNFEKVIELGIEGLTQLPGIGPKKAEAILSFAQDSHVPAPAEEPAVETVETEEAEAAETEADVEEEQEIPVSGLADVDSKFIDLLQKSGFETLAELSVTSVEELLEIQGMEEGAAKTIIEQAKQRMENVENV
ncbi:MAG: transcription termination factor NusA [Nitrospinaceae bacterium]